jgi:hypothetical protein
MTILLWIKPDWQPLLNDLDQLQQAALEKDGKSTTVSTATACMAGSMLRAAGVAISANIREKSAQPNITASGKCGAKDLAHANNILNMNIFIKLGVQLRFYLMRLDDNPILVSIEGISRQTVVNIA